MKKIILGTVILASLLTTSTVVAGEHYGKNRHFGRESGHFKLYKKLNLTATQKQQIQAIFKQYRPHKSDNNYEERRHFLEQRRQLVQSTNFDKNAVRQLAKTHSEQQTERFIALAEAENKAWNLLTPEQQQKAQAMIKQRLQKMQERRQKRLEKHKDKDD